MLPTSKSYVLLNLSVDLQSRGRRHVGPRGRAGRAAAAGAARAAAGTAVPRPGRAAAAAPTKSTTAPRPRNPTSSTRGKNRTLCLHSLGNQKLKHFWGGAGGSGLQLCLTPSCMALVPRLQCLALNGTGLTQPYLGCLAVTSHWFDFRTRVCMFPPVLQVRAG